VFLRQTRIVMNPEDYDPTRNNTTSHEGADTNPAPEPPPTSEEEPVFKDVSTSFKDAVKEGVEDAKEAARDTIPKVKEEFGRGVHDVAYGISFLVAFGATLAREFAPENATRGAAEGRSAGRKAAEDFAAKQRAAREEPEASESEPEMV